MSEKTEAFVVSDENNTFERCVGEVRWKGDVLEQAWEIKTVEGQRIVDMKLEWRPVPRIDE